MPRGTKRIDGDDDMLLVLTRGGDEGGPRASRGRAVGEPRVATRAGRGRAEGEPRAGRG